ncbi:hypothetical protein AtEden1_Chr4g0281081 [Arabidopsis thaliana]
MGVSKPRGPASTHEVLVVTRMTGPKDMYKVFYVSVGRVDSPHRVFFTHPFFPFFLTLVSVRS